MCFKLSIFIIEDNSGFFDRKYSILQVLSI